MTSAANRQLPLSGNKLWLPILVLCTLTGLACKSTKTITETTVVDKKETVHNTTTTAEKQAIAPVAEKKVEKPKATKEQPEFNIALLLPLFLNATQADSGKTAVPNPTSKIGVDYYKGVLVALDSLKANGLRVKLSVYDCQNDEEKVKQLVAKGDLEKEDLIIGPIYNTQARLVADIAKKKGIPMIAPLSPADNISNGNPNFIVANPPLEVHCEELYHFAAYSFPDADFVMLHQDNATENKYAALIEKLSSGKSGKGAKVTAVVLKSKGLGADLKSHLSTIKKNVVIIPSMDLPFLVNISKELTQLVGTYDIVVMGLPIWGTDENLRLDYINMMKVHFTASSYIQPEFYSKNNPLYKSYLEKYSNEPSENAIKGYDLMHFVGSVMMKHGKDFTKELTSEKGTGVHTAFQFVQHKATDANGKEAVDFIENHFVNVLRFQDNTLKLMTPR